MTNLLKEKLCVIVAGSLVLYALVASVWIANLYQDRRAKELTINTLTHQAGDLKIQKQALVQALREYNGKTTFLVDYIRSRNSHIGANMAAHMADTFVRAGEEFNLDPLFIAAQANIESTFRVYAKSSAGALGVMQIVPKYWVHQIDFLETADDLFNVHANIRAGAFIMAKLRIECGSLERALRCYHGGKRALRSPRDSTIQYTVKVLARWKAMELM